MKPIFEDKWGELPVYVYETNEEIGMAAALEAREIINKAISEKGFANIIVATGNSQLTFLEALRGLDHIEWGKVRVFHMDEYINLPEGHTASFPYFLHKHFLDYLQVGAFYPVPGNPKTLREDMFAYEKLLMDNPADLCALGIGENGHIAFNDPPFADFDDPLFIKKVRLDDKSRRQQVGEGHFSSIEEVPTYALSLTIPALRSAKRMLCIVPEARKAEAVYKTKNEPVNDGCPATILKETPWCTLYLDKEAAARILIG
ncbi:MAG: 6-phosphogluconolactonase [Flexilinea sp.]